MAKVINGCAVPNLPWEDKPAGCADAIWRFSGNPIIGWNPTPHSARIFNSAVIPYGEGFAGVFRSDHKDVTMHLHFGRSKDGFNWDIDDREIRWQDENGQDFTPHFAYDPRLTKIDDTYYIMWCSSFAGQPTIGLGMTKDFKTFTRFENAFLPFNRNGVLFPRKINGNFVLLSRPSDNGHTPFGDIYISESPDMKYWGKHRHVMSVNNMGWQTLKIGAGPVPIETDEGWLLIYHGVLRSCSGYVYSFGSALLDIDEPSRVLYRSAAYLLHPEKPYETAGFVPNVCFPCATLCDAPTGRLAIYYGASDTYTAVAFGTVQDIVAYTKENSVTSEKDQSLGRD
ncbi:MAG: glycoside hydrolase family 130 protein [Clostridiales bacterium]|jgi:beta-1,4-mannooligosaccharide/beta-1,4-mannosyl-N-acetylglucosamine phosphorylase|nr:glycoside hydrolase family 130 protein [Clostridiales bacterium]